MREAGRLRRPLLLAQGKPIPEELSLWSIGYPSTIARPRVAGAAAVSEADQAAARLDRSISIAETATPAAVEAGAPDGNRWFVAWADRLTTLRQEAVEKMSRSVRRSPSQISRPAEEQLNRASERLDRWIEQGNDLLAWRDIEGAEVPAADIAEPVARRSESSPVSQWIYCVAEGGADELTLDLAPVPASSRQVRVVGTAAIICAAAASVWLMRRPAATDFLYRWPHAIAFLFGIAVWAWLWLSWVGILIAAGSLFLAWRLGWPGRSLPMERSTVLRMSYSDVVSATSSK